MIQRLLRKYSVVWVSLSLIVFIEITTLDLSSLFWRVPNQAVNSIVILTVADPQLIGYRNEPSWIGWLARWDSDRYLQNSYAKMVRTVNPSMELFLGDLFDEGVEMNNKEFELTIARFRTIFPLEEHVNRVYISGDNDIGGESEPVYPHLEKRFRSEFGDYLLKNSDSVKYLTIGSLNVYKNCEFKSILNASASRSLKLLLSHVPLLRAYYHPAINKAIEEFQPAVILSAHDHTAEVYIMNRSSSSPHRFNPKNNLVKLNISQSNSQSKSPPVEFQSPTVSYRMGVSRMGYGVLVINLDTISSNTSVDFFVVWVPGRYTYVIFYLFVLLLAFIYLFLPARCLTGFKPFRSPSRYF